MFPSLLFLVTPVLGASDCAQVDLAPAATCEQLRVSIDVSKCPFHHEGPGRRDAKVNCRSTAPGKGTARAWFPEAIVRVDLVQDGFPGRSWAVAGITSSPRERSAQTAPPSAQPTEVVVINSKESVPAKKELPPTPLVAAPTDSPEGVSVVREPAVAGEPSVHVKTSGVGETLVAGYLDFYYSYNFGRPAQRNVAADTSNSFKTYATPTNRYRYYDFYHNQLSLSWAQLQVIHTQGDVTGQIDFDYGTAADQNALAGYADSEPSSAAATDLVSKNIGQAFLTYKPSSIPRLTINAGKMYTHIGFEVPRAKDNWAYSHSFTYGYGLPFWHVGVSAGYAWIPDQLVTTFYVYNGWNNFYDNNAAKTLGAQVKWTPSARLAITWNSIHGPEKWQQERDMKSAHEINAVYQINEQWSVAVEGLYGWEDHVTVSEGQGPKKADWWSGLLFARYQANDWLYGAARFEQFTDTRGWVFVGDPNPDSQSIQSYTATAATRLEKQFELRYEVRHDVANRESKFLNSGGTSRQQTTALVSALLTF